jgi:hypothetical protein
MHTNLKGVTMKRIARTLIIVALASAATAAVAAQDAGTAAARAADKPYPESAPQEIPMSAEFPNSPTYKQEHKNDAGRQSRTPNSPSSVSNEIPLSAEFPNMPTYKQEHRPNPGRASNTSAFPYSVPTEPSMADEGLVPGIAGVPPYVDPNRATGATR